MFCNSKSFSFVVPEQFDPPKHPIQIDYTEKLENIHFHIIIISFIVFRIKGDFLESQPAEVLKARIISAKIVEGCFTEEVGNVVGQIVGADVVIVDEVDVGIVDQDIGVGEIVVAEPQRLFGPWEEESCETNPITQYLLELVQYTLMQIYISLLSPAFLIFMKLLNLPIREQIFGNSFFPTGDTHLMKFIDLADDSLHKVDILKLLLAWVPCSDQKLLDSKGLLGVDDLRGELEICEVFDDIVFCLAIKAVCEYFEDVAGEAVYQNCIGYVRVPAELFDFEGLALSIGNMVDHLLFDEGLLHRVIFYLRVEMIQAKMRQLRIELFNV